MNIKQQAHTKMFIAVLGVLDSFKTIWLAVVAFASAHDALAAAIDDIRAEELKQSGTTTGITENKRLARQAMCSAAAIVGGAVASGRKRRTTTTCSTTWISAHPICST
jgi:hypothetical protein